MFKMKKSPLFFLFITIFVDFLAFGIIFPLLPYYVEGFGASAFTIGLIVSSFSLMQFIFSPIWGRVSDKVGRKPIILISLLGTSISLLGFGLAKSIAWLFATRILAGFFTAASLPTTYAYVSDFTEEKDRAGGFGMLGAAWGMGMVFGPAFGGVLSRISIATPFFAAAAIAFLNFIFAYFFLPPSESKEDRLQLEKEGLFNLTRVIRQLRGEVGGLFVIFFMAAFTLSSLEIVFPLFAQLRFGFNETSIGFFFAFIGVMVAITQGVIVSKAVSSFGEVTTVIIAHLFMIFGYFIMAFATGIPILFLTAGILAMGIALNEPSLAALISKLSKEGQGTTLGATWGFDSLARIVGPALGGFIYGRISPLSPFLANSLFLILSLIVLKLYLSKKGTVANER